MAATQLNSFEADAAFWLGSEALQYGARTNYAHLSVFGHLASNGRFRTSPNHGKPARPNCLGRIPLSRGAEALLICFVSQSPHCCTVLGIISRHGIVRLSERAWNRDQWCQCAA
jgi:hypothetical protein